MDIVGGLLFALFLLGILGLVWLERGAAKAEAEEMRQIAEGIKHLPSETQVQLWACWYRHQAEKDLW